jgi:NhaP-type Na+/H+ or K+/H+ antiporter
MNPSASATVALALGLGAALAMVCQRLRIPALLPLMLSGIVLGPEALGVIDAGLLGAALSAFISLAVGILIFEGSLHLDRETLSHAPRAVRGLLTIGALVTWVLAALLAWKVAGLPADLAIVLGAALTVTGPTVVQPMLRRVPLTPRLQSVLASEAILVDPIGVVATITTLEIVLGTRAGTSALPLVELSGYLLPLLAGSVIGAFMGFVAAQIFNRPEWHGRAGDDAVRAGALAALALAVGLSELVLHESGLVAAAVTGLVYARLAKRRLVLVRRTMEHISGILVAVLFVLLASRIDVERLAAVGWREALFVAGLVLVARPACIIAGTIRSGMTWREKAMASFMAPRGIVAISLASIVATEVARASEGTERAQRAAMNAQHLETLMILVVFVTVAITSLLTGPVASLLRVRAGPPNGVLIVGGHLLGRRLAAMLRDLDIPATIVDSNPLHIRAAREEDVPAHQGDATDGRWLQEEVLTPQIGMVFTATDNTDVDGVVARWGLEHFGPATAFRWSRPPDPSASLDVDTAGIPLAAADLSIREVVNKLDRQELSLARWRGADPPGARAVPLLAIQDHRVRPVLPADLADGSTVEVIGLVGV